MDSPAPGIKDSSSVGMLRVVGTPGKFLTAIGIYFVVQVFLRLVTSNTLNPDEAEQIMVTQQLALGYGPQPPLYAWLQYPFVKLFGPSILPLALLKNVLLFSVYVVTYFNARHVTHNHWPAVAATISLLFILQIAWESQRDLTHSVLLTLLASLAFYFFLRVRQTRRLGDYLAFGASIALGVLTKYNFLAFLFGLIFAALTLPKLRPVICDKRMLVALALCLALLSPHLWWAAQNKDVIFITADKFEFGGDLPWLKTTALGLGSLIEGFFAHISALLAIYFILFWKRPKSSSTPSPDIEIARLIGRAIAIVFALLVIGVLLFKITSFRNRWLLPVFFWLPVLLAIKCAPRLDALRMKWLVGMAMAVAVIVSVLIPTSVWFAESWGMVQRMNAPFDRLSLEIERAGPRTKFIFAENDWIGGNLKHFLPERIIFSWREKLQLPADGGDECLFIWDATRQPLPLERLLPHARKFMDFNLNEENLRYVEAPMKFFKTNQMRLGMVSGIVKRPTP